MIEVKGLHKKFGKNKVLVDLDLTIDRKGVFAILGPNGSGKSTLIKSILGMSIPDKGEINMDGKSVLRRSAYRHKIRYLPQIATFPGNLRVRELINMIKDIRSTESREQELLDLFDLKDSLNKKLSSLSGGTKQKVNILLAFMFDSEVIILDEPTTGLDPQAILNLKGLILKEKELGKTILVTSHIMQFVEEMADELVYLLEGRIYFRGSVKDLKDKTGLNNFEEAIATLLV